MYYLTGFTDEAADSLEEQIRVVRELGWQHLELRAVEGTNVHDLPEEQFDEVRKTIEDSEISVSCLGSNLANWGTSIETPFEETEAILRRTIDRAKLLKVPLVRIMSYAIRQDEQGNILEDQMESERFKRLRIICEKLLEHGLTPVHENCFNYGGMSWKHTLRLLEEVPGMKLAYDTGNPALLLDYAKPESREYQDPWEFYQKVKDKIEYVHIKDAKIDPKTGEELYYFPGKGAGKVKEIVKDLLAGGYEGGFSMEPHMAVVYHDSSVSAGREERIANFLEYGRRFERLLEEVGHPYKK